MTIRAQEIIHEARMPYTVETHNLVQQAVGETVLAILATDTRDLVCTSFDRSLVDGVISRVIDQVRNHWKFHENY